MFFNFWPFLIVERKSCLVLNPVMKENAQLQGFVFACKFKLLPIQIFLKVLFQIAFIQTIRLGKKNNNSLFGYKQHNTVLLTILVGEVICNVFNS